MTAISIAKQIKNSVINTTATPSRALQSLPSLQLDSGPVNTNTYVVNMQLSRKQNYKPSN